MRENCPCCKSINHKEVSLQKAVGFEDFLECLDCGVLFRSKSN